MQRRHLIQTLGAVLGAAPSRVVALPAIAAICKDSTTCEVSDRAKLLGVTPGPRTEAIQNQVSSQDHPL